MLQHGVVALKLARLASVVLNKGEHGIEGTLAEEAVAAQHYGRADLAAALALYRRAEAEYGTFHPGIAVGREIYSAANDSIGASRYIRRHSGIAVTKHHAAAQLPGIELATHSDSLVIDGVCIASEERCHQIGIVGGRVRQGEGIVDTVAIALALHAVYMQ